MHHRLHHFFGRHHGGRGFGHFRQGFMEGGDWGGRAFGIGRKLASADLQLLILGLLAEKPCYFRVGERMNRVRRAMHAEETEQD